MIEKYAKEKIKKIGYATQRNKVDSCYYRHPNS